MSDSIRQRLQSDVPVAMKARQPLRVSVLRTALAALANAEAVDAVGSRPATGVYANDVGRRHVDEDEARSIVAELVDELRAAALEMEALGRDDVAAEKLHQAEVLTAYLDA